VVIGGDGALAALAGDVAGDPVGLGEVGGEGERARRVLGGVRPASGAGVALGGRGLGGREGDGARLRPVRAGLGRRRPESGALRGGGWAGSCGRVSKARRGRVAPDRSPTKGVIVTAPTRRVGRAEGPWRTLPFPAGRSASPLPRRSRRTAVAEAGSAATPRA